MSSPVTVAKDNGTAPAVDSSSDDEKLPLPPTPPSAKERLSGFKVTLLSAKDRVVGAAGAVPNYIRTAGSTVHYVIGLARIHGRCLTNQRAWAD